MTADGVTFFAGSLFFTAAAWGQFLQSRRTVVRVLIGLAVFAVITVWQIGTIIGSPYPGMKAFEALGLLLPFTCCCSPRRIS
ncbi:MAG: hypothetical protein ACXVGR_15025 [Mycobacteriaceae bacterium]